MSIRLTESRQLFESQVRSFWLYLTVCRSALHVGIYLTQVMRVDRKSEFLNGISKRKRVQNVSFVHSADVYFLK